MAGSAALERGQASPTSTVESSAQPDLAENQAQDLAEDQAQDLAEDQAQDLAEDQAQDLAEAARRGRIAPCFARRAGSAKFETDLGYSATSNMYFPAGFAFVALIALVAWNTREEARRTQGGQKKQS